MSLADYLNTDNDDLINNPEYLRLMDTHIGFFKNHAENKIVTVTGLQADIYAGDLFGLLNLLNIGREYHYVVMRMNGFFSSGDFDGTITEFIVPSNSALSRVVAIYETRVMN